MCVHYMYVCCLFGRAMATPSCSMTSLYSSRTWLPWTHSTPSTSSTLRLVRKKTGQAPEGIGSGKLKTYLMVSLFDFGVKGMSVIGEFVPYFTMF